MATSFPKQITRCPGVTFGYKTLLLNSGNHLLFKVSQDFHRAETWYGRLAVEFLLFVCPVSPLMPSQSWQRDEPLRTNKDTHSPWIAQIHRRQQQRWNPHLLPYFNIKTNNWFISLALFFCLKRRTCAWQLVFFYRFIYFYVQTLHPPCVQCPQCVVSFPLRL